MILNNKGGRVNFITCKDVQIFVITILTPDPGKAVFQNAAVQIAVNDLFDVEAKEPVLLFEPVVKDQCECLEMVLHALVVWRVLGTVPLNGKSFVDCREHGRQKLDFAQDDALGLGGNPS